MKNSATTALAFFFVFCANILWAQCQTNQAGNWSAPSTWTGCGGIPTSASNVTIRHNVTVSSSPTVASVAFQSFGTPGLTINTGYTLNVTGGFTLQTNPASAFVTVASNAALNVGGALAGGGGTFNINGTINTGGNLTSSGGTFNINATAQVAVSGTLTGSGTFQVDGKLTANALSVTGGSFNVNRTLASYGEVVITNGVDISSSGDLNVSGVLRSGSLNTQGNGLLDMLTGGLVYVTGNVTANNLITVATDSYLQIGGNLTLASGNGLSVGGEVDVMGALRFSNSNNNNIVTGTGCIYYNTCGQGNCAARTANVCVSPTPLPVTWVSFVAQAEQMSGSVLLKWATSAEENNSRFEVERSGDGRQFSQIATVAGKGTFEGLSAYQFRDFAPLAGTNYYRLRQVDTDGTVAHSKVIAVSLGAMVSTSQAVISFDPVTAKLEIHALLGQQERAWVSVTDCMGKEFKQALLTGGQQTHLVALPHALPSGLYVVRVQLSQSQTAKKIFIR